MTTRVEADVDRKYIANERVADTRNGAVKVYQSPMAITEIQQYGMACYVDKENVSMGARTTWNGAHVVDELDYDVLTVVAMADKCSISSWRARDSRRRIEGIAGKI